MKIQSFLWICFYTNWQLLLWLLQQIRKNNHWKGSNFYRHFLLRQAAVLRLPKIGESTNKQYYNWIVFSYLTKMNWMFWCKRGICTLYENNCFRTNQYILFTVFKALSRLTKHFPSLCIALYSIYWSHCGKKLLYKY